MQEILLPAEYQLFKEDFAQGDWLLG